MCQIKIYDPLASGCCFISLMNFPIWLSNMWLLGLLGYWLLAATMHNTHALIFTCSNHQFTCAMQYGKKWCSELIHCCDYCYQIYLTEEKHCSFCHKTLKSIHNFSEHTSQCEEKRRTDANWKIQISDDSVPIRLRLLKLLLATVEVGNIFLVIGLLFSFTYC